MSTARINYKNWVVDASGDVVGAADVEIRHLYSGDLVSAASIYTAETGSTAKATNPFAAEADGSFSVWLAPGGYTFTLGSGASQATQSVYLVPAGVSFPTVAALAAAVTAGASWPDNTIISTPKVQFVAVSGSAVTGLPAGLLPHGKTYPNHFGDNTTPGTTDMTTAMQASANYADVVYLFDEEYLFTDTVTFTGNGKALVGAGRGITQLTCSTDAIDFLVFTSSATSVRNNRIEGFTLTYSGGAKTAGAHISFPKTMLRGTLRDIRLENVYDGIKANGAQGWIERLTILQPGLTAPEVGRYGINLEHSDGSSKTFDLHLLGCDIFADLAGAGPGLDAAVRVNVCDGIYFTTCHFHGTNKHVYTNPTGLETSSMLVSMMFTNCYFDYSYVNHVRFEGETDAGLYRNINFTGCQFRDANGTTGSISCDADVERLTVTGGCIRNSWGSGIFTNTGLSAKNWTISGVQFVSNNEQNLSGSGDIAYRGEAMNVTGCTFVDGGANGHAIGFLTGAVDCEQAGNSFEASTAGDNVVDNGTGTWHDGLQYGSNSNGEYWRHKSGELTCQHSLASSASASVTWTYPYPFLTGTVPVTSISVAAGSGPAASIPNLAGAPAATSLTFDVLNTSNARVAFTARLTAHGKWK